jgi:hypothetical protein
MADNIQRIAELLGAKIVQELPDVGGGAFGAARLAEIVAALQRRHESEQKEGLGQPADRQVPISEETMRKLVRLAEKASTNQSRISPLQLAAKLLEEALASCPDG